MMYIPAQAFPLAPWDQLEWHCFGTLKLSFTLRGGEGGKEKQFFWKDFGVSVPYLKQKKRCDTGLSRDLSKGPGGVQGGCEGG